MMPKADYTEILKSELLLTAEEPDQSTQFQAALVPRVILEPHQAMRAAMLSYSFP